MMTRRSWLIPLVLVAWGLFSIGCEGTLIEGRPPRVQPEDLPDDPSECDMTAILASERNRCVECHDATPGVEGGNLDLLSPGVETRLRDRPSGNSACRGELVVDGTAPAESMLLRMIDPERYAEWGDDACIEAMPFGAAGVSPHDVACFEHWVEEIAEGGEVPGPDDPPPPPPIVFDPMPPTAALAKVKMVLHGGAVSDDELARVTAADGSLDVAGLRGIIEGWRETPELERKVRQFLQLSLQQNEINTGSSYEAQLDRLRGNESVDRNAMEATLEAAFVHTAWDIVDEGRDFREVLTTRRWRVTTAMLAALVYMEFPGNRRDNNFSLLEHLRDADYTDWRTVEMVQAADPSEVMEYQNTAGFVGTLRDIPEGGSLSLYAPRVGFFNTPVFFESWVTNEDNQFRVTTNQMLIAALDLSFEAGDRTEVMNLNGLADAHAPPDSACYQCHRRLDPMRLTFQNAYNFDNKALTDRSDTLTPGFAFHGVLAEPETMDELADVLASHPRFPIAWTQKLCMWGTSARCDEQDPELLRIAAAFDSHHDFFQLLVDVFSSPLVTGAAPTLTHERSELFLSIARSNHVCAAMDSRLEQARADRCEAELAADPMADPAVCQPRTRGFCTAGNTVREMAGVLSEDAYARGALDFVQSTLAGPFNARAFTELCTAHATAEVGGGNRTFSQADVDGSLDRMVRFVMGLPATHPRYEAAVAGLRRARDIAAATPVCRDNGLDIVADNEDEVVCGLGLNNQRAMFVAWITACSSPDVTAVGL